MDCFVKRYAVWASALAAAMFAGGCEIGTETLPPSTDKPVATKTAEPPSPTIAPPLEAPPSRAARGKLEFVEGYGRGYAQAVSQHKPMLVFFTAPWCHFCHQMADEAFTHPQVVRLADRFVCILVDADREPEVCGQFEVTGYPTIQFISPRGVPLDRMMGKKSGRQLISAMQAALQNLSRRDAAATDSAAR